MSRTDLPIDLSDDQINTLLARASERLRARETALAATNDHAVRVSIPKLQEEQQEEVLVTTNKISRVKHDRTEDENASGIRKVEDPVLAKRAAIEKKQATAGSKWFDLPKTDLTPELKRDLQLLKMRGVLDPQRHYKKESGKMHVPEYSQVGTIVEGATEFYSGRIENKQRKRTFVEEVLAGEQQTGRFKRRYGEVQAKKGSGKKAFYQALKAKRKTGVKKGG